MSDRTASNPPARHRRGRLLIVGRESAGAAVDEEFPGAPARADNIFQAIGELAVADAARPIVAVLLPDALLPAPPARAIEALKRLDPSVRLIRIVASGGAEVAPAIEGFDECIEEPIDGDAMQRILDEAPPTPPAIAEQEAALSPPGPEPADAAGAEYEEPIRVIQPAPRPAPPQGTGSSSDVEQLVPRPVAAAGGDRKLGEQSAAGEGPPPLPPPPAPPPGEPASAEAAAFDDTEELGDTDLLEAVMCRPQGARDIALRLIGQQTGWTDLELLDGRAEAPREAAQAEVRHQGRLYGSLVTAMAATKQLLPWAQWLGHWLALDAAYREYRLMAYRDDLTGAWNRRYFRRFLEETIVQAATRRRPLTVMVFDIDDFKLYNDRYGHEAGDVILCETVALLNSVIRDCDRVCRIGGDEFAVVFADVEGPREAGSSHPESVEQIARRFQEQICTMRFPKLGLEAHGPLSISAGLATYPWDGNDPTTLLHLADQRALESKRKGKNHITYGPGAANLSSYPGE